jgi:signal transduction histidine kinase
MMAVSQASVKLDRVASGWRRVAGAPWWPPAAAAVLAPLALAEVVAGGGDGAADLPTGLLLALGTTAPLALARSHPPAAAATVTAATLLTLAGGHRLTWAGLAAQLAVVVALALAAARRVRGGTVELAASRRAFEDTLLEHATRGERARIARELHDVVAHHISMIAVQSELARLATPGMPAEGAERLRAIGDTARTALTEMRRLLGVLRADAGGDATRRPQPGLDQLNGLLDEARDTSGASTRLLVSGRVVPLGPGIELTAYRIVQEALTNARRHAPGAAVDVELHYGGDALRLRVRDNGPGPPDHPAGAGHGLLGMRERAAMVGGSLRTGPAAASGFLVEAVLPTAEPDR